MMVKQKKNIRLFLTVCVLLCVLILAFLSIMHKQSAYAGTIEKKLSIKQTAILYYCGQDFLYNNAFVSAFLSAFTATFDDEEFELNINNTSVSCDESITDPGTYSCVFTVNDGEKEYVSDPISVRISKREVVVTVYLNGKTELTVKEGENVYVWYDYDGAIEKDYTSINRNGVTIRTLIPAAIDSVAYVEYLPTTAVQNYTVSAAHATSKYYSFTYRKSTLNIVEQTVPELTFVSNDTVLVYLFGEFSSASELSVVNVGTNMSSPDYKEIKEKVDTVYDATEIKNDYEAIACYKLNVAVNNTTSEDVACNVFILLDESFKKRTEYKVIAFYNNGDTEVLNARTVNSDGYLLFTAKDMGEFVIVSPVEGIKISTYIIVISVAVVFVLLVIFFASLFRRKY